MTISAAPDAIRIHLRKRGPVASAVHAVADTAWDLLGAGLLDLPLPGSGSTMVRWRALAEVAAVDLAVARLVEGHLEAQSIHADAGRPLPDGLWQVWSASSREMRMNAEAGPDGWVLHGSKQWCSGARSITTALVTARDELGERLFAVPVRAPSVRFDPESWPAVGMALSDTLVMSVDRLQLPATAEVGGSPGWYYDRPGFWAQAAAVAATWYGGGLGIARTLRRWVAESESDPFGLVHLGFVDAMVTAMDAALERAAVVMDSGNPAAARSAAWQARAAVEHLATALLRRAGQAFGQDPVTHDAALARRVADLTIHLRQHGAEREYAALGADVLDSDRLV